MMLSDQLQKMLSLVLQLFSKYFVLHFLPKGNDLCVYEFQDVLSAYLQETLVPVVIASTDQLDREQVTLEVHVEFSV